MKLHTTNYFDTFILVADDCPGLIGEQPPVKEGAATVANLQFNLIKNNPYKYSSDDVIFEVFAIRQEITATEKKKARELFFSKGQPCLRASPLTKRYGWGVHSDSKGKIALFGCETEEYKKLSGDRKLTILKAMRSAK